MARVPRSETIDPSEIQIVHVCQQVNRQAYLLRTNEAERRSLVDERARFQSQYFCLDLLCFSVMSNHVHFVLRSRPDIVASLSDKEIATRWLMLCPSRKSGKKTDPPTEKDLASILNDPEAISKLRLQLSDVSWWMRLLAQSVAIKINAEDKVQGHFWAGRFRADLLESEEGVLACTMYVDLNPIRAAMAETLEGAEFTSAKHRIDDVRTQQEQSKEPVREREYDHAGASSSFLSPIEIAKGDPLGVDACVSGCRASNKGFLAMSLEAYLDLLDWVGRQIRPDKRGSISASAPPILKQLGIEAKSFISKCLEFGESEPRCKPPSMAPG